MALADRIIVMNKVSIVEEGAPVALYRQPQTGFAAEFLGQTNVIPVSPAGELPWGQAAGTAACMVPIRPENIAFNTAQDGTGRILGLTFLGPAVEYRVEVAGTILRVRDSGTGVPILPAGALVRLTLRVPPHPLRGE